MKKKSNVWSWSKGLVDKTGDHFELRYGSAKQEGLEEWLPVALVGKSKAHKFAVQFLIIQGSDPLHADIIQQVKQQLDFFLVEKGEVDPWGYAQYHCGTFANIFSQIHWSYFPKTGS